MSRLVPLSGKTLSELASSDTSVLNLGVVLLRIAKNHIFRERVKLFHSALLIELHILKLLLSACHQVLVVMYIFEM
jgi:hypothetical protein